MITPRFSCSQTEKSVIVDIQVSAIRASEVEIHVEDQTFTLHVNPYFLRLCFPGDVLEDDDSSANYDPSTGSLKVTLTKKNRGEHFEDLDLLTKLLAPVKSRSDSPKPIVEVLQSSEDELADAAHRLSLGETDDASFQRGHENDWQIEQSLPEPEESSVSVSLSVTYGFHALHSGYFKNVQYTENEINELGPDAETLPASERRKIREDREDEKFDDEYYLADLVNDEEIRELILWKHPFAPPAPAVVEFSESEKLVLTSLPRREYLISPTESKALYYTLFSLLFAYAYESRSNMHDPTPESAWTISVLIPAFSALDTSPSSSLHETLRASYRRALAFPLYRSWELCDRCNRDTADILRGGKRTVLKALLEVKYILDRHEVYYVYCKIWVDDFCVWIQRYAEDDALIALAEESVSYRLEKSSIGWDLDELESAVQERTTVTDSDDESENEIERMTPSAL